MWSACTKHFSSPAARLETFKYFSNSAVAEELVESGFFLEIDNHTATCFSCGSCFDIQNTSIKTDFKTIHLKLNSNCAFIDSVCSTRDAKKIASRVKYLKPLTFYTRQQASFNEDFKDCYNRLKSLPETTTNKKKIARAGFYAACNKYVCFECGVRVRSFQHTDPWKLHCKLSPRCAHLLINRGFFFVQNNQ